MKRILVTDDCATYINDLRDSGWDSLECAKGDILDSFCGIAGLILDGRDKDSEIGSHVDELLSMMCTLTRYKELLDLLTDTGDGTLRRYELVNDDQGNAIDYNKVMDERETEAIIAMYGEQIDKLSPLCAVQALTMMEVAVLLNMQASDLRKQINDYHNHKKNVV